MISFKNNLPIGRGTYFKNFFVIALIQIPFHIPMKMVEVYEKNGQSFSETLELLFLLISSIGFFIATVLSLKNVFNRARDIENSELINKWKWGFLAFFPILAFYGQFRLLFRKGSI